MTTLTLCDVPIFVSILFLPAKSCVSDEKDTDCSQETQSAPVATCPCKTVTKNTRGEVQVYKCHETGHIWRKYRGSCSGTVLL